MRFFFPQPDGLQVGRIGYIYYVRPTVGRADAAAFCIFSIIANHRDFPTVDNNIYPKPAAAHNIKLYDIIVARRNIAQKYNIDSKR